MSDLLFDDDPDEDSGPPINVLAVSLPAETSDALTLRAAMYRDPDYRAAAMVIFEEEDSNFANAPEFQRAMRSPGLPTMDEAGAWLLRMRDAVAARAVVAGDG
jgi:hypothetical protein